MALVTKHVNGPISIHCCFDFTQVHESKLRVLREHRARHISNFLTQRDGCSTNPRAEFTEDTEQDVQGRRKSARAPMQDK